MKICFLHLDGYCALNPSFSPLPLPLILSLSTLSFSYSFSLMPLLISLSLRPYLSLYLTLCLPFLSFSDFLSFFYSFSVSLPSSVSIAICCLSECPVSSYLSNVFLSLPPVALRYHSHEKYNRHQTISDSKSPDL